MISITSIRCNYSNHLNFILVLHSKVDKNARSQSPIAAYNGYTSCIKGDCQRDPFRRGYCKKHFTRAVRVELRKAFRNLYRAADKAYSSMDFTGIGYIAEEDFLNSMACIKIGYSKEDVREFVEVSGMFKKDSPGMNFDTFKKTFFPHLYLINDDLE